MRMPPRWLHLGHADSIVGSCECPYPRYLRWFCMSRAFLLDFLVLVLVGSVVLQCCHILWQRLDEGDLRDALAREVVVSHPALATRLAVAIARCRLLLEALPYLQLARVQIDDVGPLAEQ